MNITLTSGQAVGKQQILSFMDNPNQSILMLKGYAGTGKTTLIQEVIRELPKALPVAFTAPTNKATKVLESMAYAAGVEVSHVSTIYSLLGLVLKPDGETKSVGSGSRGSSVHEYRLVVMDEASMLKKSVLKKMLMALQVYDVKFILMGDPLQLPPVGEPKSPAFDVADVTVELTEVVRQASDNPIIHLTELIREAITDHPYELSLESATGPGGQGVYVLPKAKWIAWMRAGFNSQAYADDRDSFKAVAWRNDTVNYLNGKIRSVLYGDDSEQPFIVGERVLTASSIKDAFGEELLAAIDSEGVVRSVQEGVNPGAESMGLGTYKVYHLMIWFEETGMADAYVLHPDAEREYNRTLNSLRAAAKESGRAWPTFWAFHDSFHDIRPAHALTSHRSQGSTYGNVFVDVGDIFANHDRIESLKSLYVACSRARSNLMILL